MPDLSGSPLKAIYRTLRPYLQPHRAPLGVVAVLSLVGAGVGLLPPAIARHLVDDVFVGGHGERLVPLLAAGFTLSVFAMGVGGLARLLYTRTTTSMLAEVRQSLLWQLLNWPLPALVRQRVGDLVSRVNNDVAEAQRALTDTGLQIATGLLQTVGAAICLFLIDGRLALASLLAGPLLWLSFVLLQPRTLANARDLRHLTGEVMAFLTETLQGVAHIQAHDAQARVQDRYAGWNRRFNEAVMRQVTWSGLAGAIPSVILGANALVVLGYGGHRIQGGTLTVGALIAFAAYQWRFLAPLRGFVGLGLRMQQAQAALERLQTLWQQPLWQEAPGLTSPPEGVVGVELQDVWFSYDPGRSVLQGVTADVPAGLVTALVGPNGAGKTTLLHLLLKLLPLDAGTIQVNGQDIAAIDGTAWRGRLGLVAQDGVFFHASLADNLRLALSSATDVDLRKVIQQVGLADTVAAWPEGMDTVIGERGARLSGGQRQRVNLARALLRDPDLLILDEATSALDMLSEGPLWEALKAERLGRTTLVVTHRRELAATADHVLVLAAGRIVAAGPPETVLAAAQAEELQP